MTALNLGAWWDELAYKRAQGSFTTKGRFILGKLAEYDAAKLETVLDDMYRGGRPHPQDITRFEWQTILAYLDASPKEIEARLFPLSAVAYWPRRWKQALAKARIRYRKPHNLRHSFASILLSRGENILKVQKAGGWRSATILLTTYAKWIDQGEKKSPVGTRMRAPRRVSLRGV